VISRVLTGFGLWLALWAGAQAAPSNGTLHLYNWDNYLNPAVLRDFEKETGIKVVEDKFASNEELLAKLQSGAGGYDLAVPSDYMVRVMIRQKLLAPLDHRQLPHLGNLGARFRNPGYDPGLRYSVPYLWGMTAIGYNTRHAAPGGWDDLFNPDKLGKLRGRVSMLNDMREAIGAALIYRGYSPNSIRPKELEAARAVLLAQKPFLAKYDSEAYKESLAAGEIWLAHGWSGELYNARRENPGIAVAVPREGSFLFVDNLVIPKGARNRPAAERFIDYLLRADVAARNVNHLRYPTPNEAARKLIDPKLEGANLRIPANVRLHSLEDLGENARLYEKIWTELKAR
jgi:spermidine/putrescine-binding protein